MEEGQLKKGINSLADSDSEIFPYSAIVEQLEKIIDEAKQEFPLLTPELERDFPNLWAFRLNEQRADWFKQWFGGEKE